MSAYSDLILADNPLAYWRQGELAGTTAADQKGILPGTYYGVSLGQPGALVGDSDTSALYGNDGTRMEVPPDARHQTLSTWTIEAWFFQTSAMGGINVGISHVFVNPNLPCCLGFDASRPGVPFAGFYASGWHQSFDSSPLPLNTWVHLVATYDGATIKLYRNEVLVSTLGASGWGPADASCAFRVGGDWNSGSSFPGRLDEVALYPVALSQAQVDAHFNVGSGGDVPPTIDPPRQIRVKTSTGWADLVVPGPPGATGPAGPGVPQGGTTGQILAKWTNTDYATVWENAPSGGGVEYVGAYSGATTYHDGDYVVGSDGVTYQCVKEGTVGVTPVPWSTGGSGMPTGSLIDWPAAAPPAGFLLCDGSAVSRTTYATLYALLGSTYGAGDGSTTFNLPDFRGRVAVGLGTQADVAALGQNDGAPLASRRPRHFHANTLTLPDHGHGVTDPGHIHLHRGGGSGVGGLPSTNASAGVQPDNGEIVTALTGVAVGNPTSYPAIPGGIGPQVNAPQDGPSYIVINKVIKT